MSPSIRTRLTALFHRHRGLVYVTLAAFAVRLVWSVAIHHPMDFAYSDMGGYLARADEMLTHPWLPTKSGPPPRLEWRSIISWLEPRLFGPKQPYLTLYPYGTHAIIAGIKLVFGIKNRIAIGAGFAAIGALAVGYTFATAARLTPSRKARRWVAAILIVYYPWIAIGGYALSELPFLLCVAAVAFHGLRLADEGRRGDAWALGIWLAVGALVRPQILVSIPLLVLFALIRRRVFHRFSWGFLPRIAVPLALALSISAWRVQWHMGTKVDLDHLISTNGPMNRVFGRCHNTVLISKAKDGGGWFGPPALGALLAYEKEHPGLLFRLDPAMGTSITFQGHMWDAAPTDKLSRDCVKKTGYLRQAKYAVTHVVLLWGYNIIWPDMGHALKWRIPMAVSCFMHAALIMPPAALAMLLAFRRRRARSMLLALHIWALIAVSILYFGDTRYRAPYDGLLIILAVVTYPEIGRVLRRAFERLRARLQSRRAIARATSSSPPGSGPASAASAAASTTSRIR